mmetsp:Transcript_105309/g.146779  ORF Transcript_105309/g.146779 Transcript_105309/m.146779 type:complete len:158 (+) Transcript_105309:130-603(+)
MVGEGFLLKIIDFDLAHLLKNKHTKCISKGTKDHRAPELKESQWKYNENFDFRACDVYSLGVILFTIMSSGYLPFKEDTRSEKLMGKLRELFVSGKKGDFWVTFCLASGLRFSDDYMCLINDMLDSDPAKRPTISQIMENSWFKNDDVYDVNSSEYR